MASGSFLLETLVPGMGAAVGWRREPKPLPPSSNSCPAAHPPVRPAPPQISLLMYLSPLKAVLKAVNERSLGVCRK
jgi:hypothetical protein